MNRLTAILLFLSACLAPAWGQWQRQYPLPKMENVVDLAVSAEGYGIAVGANAMVLLKSASATTWNPRPEPVSGWSLVACDVADGQGGQYLAVGGTGLAISTDGSVSWDEVAGAPPGIKHLRILAPGDIMVIASSGVFRYQNESWENLGLPVSANVDDGDILDDQHVVCYTIGAGKALYATSNGGGMWSSTNDVADPDAVRYYNAQYLVAADGRMIYHSYDGGGSWQLISNNAIHNSTNDIAFGSGGNVLMAATFNADPAFSSDSGRTWTQLSLNLVNQRNYSVEGVSDQEFWVGNDISSITHTTDAGATWVESSGPERRNINDIHFINRNTGFAVGSGGKLLRTTNAGGEWVDLTFDPNRTYFCIAGLNTNDLWIGTNQRILHSTNAGESWDDAGIFPGGNITDILPLSGTTVLATTTGSVIIRSEDAGATWDTVYTTPVPNTQLRSLARLSGQRILATGFNGVVVRSEDNGANWAPVAVPEAGLQYEQSHFIGDEGWMVTSSFKKTMWHTTNGGDSWDPIALPVDRNWDGVYFITPDTGIVVGRTSSEGRAYITYTGGTSWQPSYILNFPLYGVSGIPNPNGTAWIHGFGSDIEVLPYCNILPVLSGFQGDLSPCEQDTVMYTVTGEDVDEYFWFFPPGWQPIGNTDNDTVLVIAGNIAGNINVTASNTCGLANNISNPATPLPVPQLVRSAGDDEACEGDQVYFGVFAPGVATLSWSIPGDWSIVEGDGTDTILVLVGTASGPVQVVGNNDCGADTASWSVLVNLRPTLASLVGDESPCPGETLVLTAEAEFAEVFNWSIPPGWILVGPSNTTSISVIPDEAGTVSVTAVNECGASEALELVITPEDVPSASLIANGADLFLTQEGESYQWFLNGEAIPGANAESYTALVTGDYYCQVTFANGCSTTTNTLNIVITANDDPAILRGLALYPSPTSGILAIRGLDAEYAFSIVALDGQAVQRGRTDGTRIDLHALPAGNYILRLELPEGPGHLRFVRQ